MATCILRGSNCLLCTALKLKSMISKLELEHKKTNYFSNGHVVSEGFVNGALEECPKCIHLRLILKSNDIPYTLSWYFPLVSKLWLYRWLKKVVELHAYCARAKSKGSIIKSLMDNLQWKETICLSPDFEQYASHLRLTLIIDKDFLHGN